MADIPMFHFDVRPVPQPYQSPLTLSMAQLVGAGDKYQAQAIQQSAAATARGVENIGQNVGDTLATYAKYQLRQQDPQYQLERMRLQKAREDEADDTLIRQTMAANGGDMGKTLTALEKSGGIGITAAAKVRTMVAADAKDKLDTTLKQFTLREKATELLSRGLPDSPQDPTNPDQVKKFTDDYRAVYPDIVSMVGPQFSQGLPHPDDPDVIAGVARAKQFGQTNEQRATAQLRAMEMLRETRLSNADKRKEEDDTAKFVGRMLYTAKDQGTWQEAIDAVTPLIPGDQAAKDAMLARFGDTYSPEARARAGVFGQITQPRAAAGALTDPVEKARMLDTVTKNPQLFQGLREATRESLMSDLQDRGFTFPAVTEAQIIAAKARRDTALAAVDKNPRLMTEDKAAARQRIFDAYDDQVGTGAGGIVPPGSKAGASAAANADADAYVKTMESAAPSTVPAPAPPAAGAGAVPPPGVGFADQPPGVPNADQGLTPTVTPTVRPPVAGVPDERQFTSNVRVGGQPAAPAAGAAPAAAATATPNYGYGNRYGTNTPKGLGYYGPLARPDNGKTMSEYSIGVMIDGKETEVPSLVPGLTQEEVTGILTAPEGTKPPPSVEQKAAAFAKARIAAGKSPFAGPGEQQMDLYPGLKRNEIPPIQPPAKAAKLPVMNPDKVHLVVDGQRIEFDDEASRDEFMRLRGLSFKPNPNEPGAPPAPATPGADNKPAPTTPSSDIGADISSKSVTVTMLPPNGKQRVDPQFLPELKRREGGFVPTNYDDSGTGSAIGYGMHYWKGKEVKDIPDLHVTQKEADAEMERQIATDYGRRVNSALKVPVTQDQYNELISMMWNSPEATLALVAKLNAHEPLTERDFQRSATVKGDPTKKTNKGLSDRRRLEAAPFLNP